MSTKGITQQRTNRRKYAIGYNIPNWVFQIHNWRCLIQLGILNLFSDYALPDTKIPNPQLGKLSPTVDLISPIGDNMTNREYFCQLSSNSAHVGVFLCQRRKISKSLTPQDMSLVQWLSGLISILLPQRETMTVYDVDYFAP